MKQQQVLRIGQVLSIIAIASLLMLSLSLDDLASRWALMQAILGLIGLVFVWHTFPDERIHAMGFLIALLLLLVVQIVTAWQTTLTLTDDRMALYFVLVAITEELFFRGVLITPAIKSGNELVKWNAVFLSTIAFTFIHFNYWGDISRLAMVALSGIVLGFIYIKWESISLNILAHLFINILAVGSVMYL